MATNNFLIFAGAGGANVLSQSAYASDSDLANGAVAGLARAQLNNKTQRQATIMAGMIAQLINDVSGDDALDTGSYTTLLASLKKTLNRISSANVTGPLTGSTVLTANQVGEVLLNGAGGGFTVTLPTIASGNGQYMEYHFARTDTSTNLVTIALGSGNFWQPGAINSTTTVVMKAGQQLRVCSDGISGWYLEYFGVPIRTDLGNPIVANFLVPPGITQIFGRCWGAGGGGGGSANSGSAGSGGGGGGFTSAVFPCLPGSIIVLTVGAGGGGGGPGANGGAGGTSSIGSVMTATGGTGGAGSSSGAAGSASPGTASSSIPGAITLNGSSSTTAGNFVSSVWVGGTGGFGFSTGSPTANIGPGNGQPASFYSQGGNGAGGGALNGGDGYTGFISLEY